jgi:hypothetical protein
MKTDPGLSVAAAMYELAQLSGFALEIERVEK